MQEKRLNWLKRLGEKLVMNKKYDILSLGEMLIRFSPMEEERINSSILMRKQAAGAELNVMCGASLLGLHTGMLSKVPDNAIGRFVLSQGKAFGVDMDYVCMDDSKDARMGIYYYEGGAYPRSPGVIYDRKNSSATCMEIGDFPEEIYASTRCFHVTGITLAISEECRKVVYGMIRHFKEAGAMISFDVNFRENLWSGEEARVCIEKILPFVDVFFCSESTANLTFHKKGNIKEVMKQFAEEYSISVVASTQRIVHSPKHHSFGSIIYDKNANSFFSEKAYENIEIVDRIGSGDAYIAGALYGLLSKDGNIKKMVQYGNAASALKNTIPGDLPEFELREVKRVIQNHQNVGMIQEMQR